MIDAASQQLPPADELAAIRADLKRLEEREGQLRSILLSDPSARTGNRFLVEVRTITQDRTDVKELRACHPSLVEEFTFPHEIRRLELREIDEETGEITSLKRRRDEAV